MKKYSLTLILVLCLFVITGGTYAAWQYYESTVQSANVTSSKVTIDSGSNSDAAGVLTFENNTLAISITEGANYTPGLSLDGSVDIILTKGAEESVIPSFTVNAAELGEQSVFTIVGSVSVNSSDFTQVDGKKYKASLSFSKFASVITLNSTKLKGGKLPTYADYEGFATAVRKASIQLTVAEA